ncbi:MAG: helix-turn-helix domain-containing protein [Mycetocola sp.]
MTPKDAPRRIVDRSIEQFASADLVCEGTRGRGALEMNATVHALGPVLLVNASGDAQEIERRPLAPGMPTLDFIFVEKGTFAYSDGAAWEERKGPLMIAPSGLPQQVRFITPWRFLVARIATEALEVFAPMFPQQAHVYDQLTLPERAMHGYLASVANGAAPAAGESLTASRLIIEMAGAVLRERRSPAQEQRPHGFSDLWSHAIAVIVNESSDPALDPTLLAHRVGCSLRRLQTEFAAHGTTVATEIRRERAHTALTMLRDTGRQGQSSAETARRSGFGSTSTMYRAVSDFYGTVAHDIAPSEPRPGGTSA